MTVSVTGNIEQSIIVTGDSNKVQLSLGQFSFHLDARHRPNTRRRRGAAKSDADILNVLNPSSKVISLVGRERELETLASWLDEEVDISVHAIIGSAGTGKTRLAIELCELIEQAKSEEPWRSGFIRSSDLDGLAERFMFRQYQWQQSLLLVVDYAANNVDGLCRWLDALAQLDELPGKRKLRVLLLERHASQELGWWKQVSTPSLCEGKYRAELFYASEPIKLEGLYGLEERRGIVAQTLKAAKHISQSTLETTIPCLGEDTEFDKRLAGSQFSNPLALVMAGLLSLTMSPTSALTLHYLDAATSIARREIERFEKMLPKGQDVTAFNLVLCFHLLCGGVRISKFRETLTTELKHAGWTNPDVSNCINLMTQEFNIIDKDNEDLIRLPTPEPELISEAMCLILLSSNPELRTMGGSIFIRALNYGKNFATSAVVRLIQDFAYPLVNTNADETQRRNAQLLMGYFNQLIEHCRSNKELILLLDSAIPQYSIVMAEPALKLSNEIYQLMKNVPDHERALPGKAEILNNLAVRLDALGKRDQALLVYKEATQYYRKLAQINPSSFQPELACTLLNLSGSFLELSKLEDALSAAEEALIIARQLVKNKPEAYLPQLANALNTIACCLSKLDQPESALSAAEEAVFHYREIVTSHQDAFKSKLANSLITLSFCLETLGRSDESLSCLEEATPYLQQLVELKPDAFQPDLALSLNNLASRLNQFGWNEKASQVAQESVRLYRELAKVQSDAYLPYLANSLNNLANCLSELNRPEEALQAAAEAERSLRPLAEEKPDIFQAELAHLLNNLANRLSEFNRKKEALQVAREATCHYRELAESQPGAFQPDLARSLNNLANRLKEFDQDEEALSVAEEALNIWRQFIKSHPGTYCVFRRL